MKFKTILFVLCLTMFFSASAFAVAVVEVELESQDNTQMIIKGAAVANGYPLLKLKLENTTGAAVTVTQLVFRTDVVKAIVAAELTATLYKDANNDGVLNGTDSVVKAATAIPPVADAGNGVITMAAITLAIPANSTVQLILNINAAGAVATTTNFHISWNEATAGAMIVSTGNVLDTDYADKTGGDATLLASDLTNIRDLLVTAASVAPVMSAGPTVAVNTVGNKAQAVTVSSATITPDATASSVLETVGLVGGAGMTGSILTVDDVSTFNVFLDDGTTADVLDDSDTLIGSCTGLVATELVGAALGEIDLTLPMFLNGGSAAINIFVVADLSGTAGLQGTITDATAKEILRVDVDASGTLIDGGATGGVDSDGPLITMIPLYVTKVETQDIDGNGIIDNLKLTFSDNVNDALWGSLSINADVIVESSAGDGALAGGNDAVMTAFSSTTNGDVANNTIIYATFDPSSLPAGDRSTAGLPEFAVLADAYVQNAVGNKALLEFNTAGDTQATADKAPPIIYSAYTGDADVNGHIDRVTVSFSEAMLASGTAHLGVTFTDAVFSSYTSASATVSGSSVVFTVNEKGEFDTEAAPAFAYDATLGDLKDAASVEVVEGVLQTSPTEDKAPPAVVTAVTGDNYNDEAYLGATKFESIEPNGRLDTIVITLSEAVAEAAAGNIDVILTTLAFVHPAGGFAELTAANVSTVAPYSPAPSLVNSGTYGTDDTGAVITVYFQEVSHAAGAGITNYGDTGEVPTYAYAAAAGKYLVDLAAVPNTMADKAAIPTTDGAAPFIVDGMLQLAGGGVDGAKILSTNADAALKTEEGNWDDKRFANVKTIDNDALTPDNADPETGDGFLDTFEVKFSESIKVTDVTAVDEWTITNTALFSTITIASLDNDNDPTSTFTNGSATSTLYLVGLSSMEPGMHDTGLTPTVTYSGTNIIDDGAAAPTNKALANTKALESLDGAAPVIVFGLGAVNTTDITVTWSEDIFADATGVAAVAFGASNGLFGYLNDTSVTVDGSTALDVAVATVVDNIMILTTNVILTLDDVENDSIWVKIDNVVFDSVSDNTNTEELDPAFVADNKAGFNVLGPGYRVNIDDTIRPWVSAATTIDIDGDGYVDYLRIVMSEKIDDESVTGYVSADAMGTDASGVWDLSGYEGALYFNFFTGGTVAGQEAAFTAGEPIFTDNGVDDTQLYLKIDGPLTIALTNGLGTTEYAPTLSWTSPTVHDMKPSNLLDEVASVDAAVDAVGPVVMKAETKTTRVLEVTFSEDIDDTSLQLTDFGWLVSNVGQTPETGASWAQYTQTLEESSAGIVQFTVSPVGAWEASMGGKFGLIGNVADLALNAAGAAAPNQGRLNWTGAASAPTSATSNFYKDLAAATASTVTVTPVSQYVAVFDPVLNNGFMVNNIDIIIGVTGGGGGLIDPPADLVLTDVPDDNGHWMFATFTVSADHLTSVKSYQFYREVDFGTEETPDLQWVYSSVVPAGMVTDGKMVCLVPSVIDGLARWAVVASTGDAVTDPVAFKEAGMPVAQLVEGAAEKAAEGITISEMAITVVPSGSIDNTAPSPIVAWSADDNEGDGTGIILSWTAPDDHTAVTTVIMSVEFYGVTEYQVYRRVRGAELFALVGAAGPLSTSFVDDTMEDGVTVYEYYIKCADSNPDHLVETGIKSSISSVGGADFNSDGVVGYSDFTLLAVEFFKDDTQIDFVPSYDLNDDGEVEYQDFTLFAVAFNETFKIAKAVPTLPVSDISFGMGAEFDESSSLYSVNINIDDMEMIEGFNFYLSYDVDKVEYVNDSITGLGEFSITKTDVEGIINVNSVFVNDEFSGSVTLNFESIGKNSEFEFEILGARVTIDGITESVTDLPSEILRAVPEVFALSQNYPNPFNPSTTIDYSITKSGHVELVIWNLAGQKVRTLVNEKQAAAYYTVIWDGRNDSGESVASGLYFYRLVSSNFNKIEKMTLVK